jgi:hypothetical protein
VLGHYQVELVAFRVGEGGPPGRRLAHVLEGRGAEGGQAPAFRLELVGAQVQVEAVLDRLGLGPELISNYDYPAGMYLSNQVTSRVR